MVEAYVLERLLAQGKMVSFYRRREKEIDFLLPKDKQALEVKYCSQLRAANFGFLTEFSQGEGFGGQVVSLQDYGNEMFAGELGVGLKVRPAMLF